MKSFQPNDQTLSELFKQLALLMQSGIQIGDALTVISEEQSDKNYQELLKGMASSLDEGIPFAQTLADSGAFSMHCVGLIQTGEQVGRIEETLLSLSYYYESKVQRKKKLYESLTYPLILTALMVIVVVILLTQVLPIFHDVYASLGGKLTGVAHWLLVAGNAINLALPYVGIVCSVAAMVSAIALSIPAARQKLSGCFLRVFGDRGSYRKMNDATFMQALSVAIGSGIPFEDGAQLAAESLKDVPKAYARCQKCIRLIEEGANLEDALCESKLVSRSSAYLLKLGIRAGKGDETVLEIANRMERDAEDAMNARLSRIEPALVIATSLVTGLILLTVMLPLIDIMKTIG